VRPFVTRGGAEGSLRDVKVRRTDRQVRTAGIFIWLETGRSTARFSGPPEEVGVRAMSWYNAVCEIELDRRRRTRMDASRKASREGNETTLQYQSPHDALLTEELNEERLRQLLEFMSRLKETPPGVAEIQRRVKLFGECIRIEGETSGQFYGRLRHWLDRDLLPTKSPLHAPRQTDD
jgi:hypothetical protein